MAQAAAAAQGSGSPGPLFMLVWGLSASVYGLLTVTNFHGFADRTARRWPPSSARRRRPSPWQSLRTVDDPVEQTRRIRRIAIPFAVAGPVVAVIGLISISRGGIADSGPDGLPGPYRFLLIGLVMAALLRSWRSRCGLFRHPAWHRGWRLAVALLSSLGLLVFGIGFAVGQMTAAVVGMVIAGSAYLILAMNDKPPGPGPGTLPNLETRKPPTLAHPPPRPPGDARQRVCCSVVGGNVAAWSGTIWAGICACRSPNRVRPRRVRCPRTRVPDSRS
jgi:hypothetical protein